MSTTKRTHYEILGLPRNATLVQIKRKFRLLARKYHPDVAENKELAHKLFLQINEAYQTLSDPERRRAYDTALDHLVRQAVAASTKKAESDVRQTPKKSAAEHVKDAQWAFIQRRFQDAAVHCKEAIRIDEHNSFAHVILGDIYRVQKKYNSAIRAYSNALQINPDDLETEKKLSRVVSKQVSVEQKKQHSLEKEMGDIAGERTAARSAYNTIWWVAVFLLIMLIGVFPGTPIKWLGVYIPQVALWSWNLVGLMSAASAVAGILLSVNGVVNHPDEELLFESGVLPTGMLLLLGSGFFFLAAAGIYMFISLIQGTLSKSVMTVFACVMAVVLLSALNYDPAARKQVLLFGGNIAFFSCLIGWYIGSMLKPFGEY